MGSCTTENSCLITFGNSDHLQYFQSSPLLSVLTSVDMLSVEYVFAASNRQIFMALGMFSGLL